MRGVFRAKLLHHLSDSNEGAATNVLSHQPSFKKHPEPYIALLPTYLLRH